MTDLGSKVDMPVAEEAKRWRMRWSLGTLMLFTAAVCIWTAYFQLRVVNPRLAAQIAAMERLSSTLRIDDPNQVGIARIPETWFDEAKWNVYLPSNHRYRLCLATRGIPNHSSSSGGDTPPPIVGEYQLDPGSYQIELRHREDSDGWLITVLVNEEKVIAVTEDPQWHPGSGSEGGALFDRPSQRPVSRYLPIYRRRFTAAGGNKPQASDAGIELWIEEVAD